jgi:hypothetical protein
MRARGRCSVATLAVLSVAMSLPMVAGAACPASVAPRVPPPSGSPPPPIQVVMPRGFFVHPQIGRAPLEIRMLWSFPQVDDAVRFEIDADGDGKFEWSDTEEPHPQRHTFTQPGTYMVTGRVTGRAGHVVTARIPVRVMPAAAFDAEMSGRWATFKAALARNDLSQALECVTTNTREDAERALQPGSQWVAFLLPHADTLTFWRKSGSVALAYVTDFVDNRAPTLIFAPDVDDVWRIDARGWPVPSPPGGRPASPQPSP